MNRQLVREQFIHKIHPDISIFTFFILNIQWQISFGLLLVLSLMMTVEAGRVKRHLFGLAEVYILIVYLMSIHVINVKR